MVDGSGIDVKNESISPKTSLADDFPVYHHASEVFELAISQVRNAATNLKRDDILRIHHIPVISRWGGYNFSRISPSPNIPITPLIIPYLTHQSASLMVKPC